MGTHGTSQTYRDAFLRDRCIMGHSMVNEFAKSKEKFTFAELSD